MIEPKTQVEKRVEGEKERQEGGGREEGEGEGY